MKGFKKYFVYLMTCLMLITVTTTVKTTVTRAEETRTGETKFTIPNNRNKSLRVKWVKQKVNKKTKYQKLKKKATKTYTKTTKKKLPPRSGVYSPTKFNSKGYTWAVGWYYDTKVTKKYYKKGSKKVKVYTYIDRKVKVETFQYYDK